MTLRGVLFGVLMATTVSTAGLLSGSAQEPTQTSPVSPTPVTSSTTTTSGQQSTNSGSVSTSPATSVPMATTYPVTPTRDLLAESAIEYGSFHADVAELDRDFQSLQDINETAKRLAARSPESLSSGWLAYSALIASDSSELQAGVEEMRAAYGRDRTMEGLSNNWLWILDFDGAEDAIGRAMKVSKADAARLERHGSSISDQSTALQLKGFGWAKARLKDQSTILHDLEMAGLSERRVSSSIRTMFDVSNLDAIAAKADGMGSSMSLWDNISSGSTVREFRLPGISSSGFTTFNPFNNRNREYDFVKTRVGALAAYRILNGTDTDSAELRRILVEDVNSGGLSSCLNNSRAEFNNCVHDNYSVFERPKCIGVHQVSDFGSCIRKVAD